MKYSHEPEARLDGPEAPWSFEKRCNVNKETMKLILSMPPELLTAWEAKHPAKWNIRYIAKNYARRQKIAFAIYFTWVLSMLYGALKISSHFADPEGPLGLAVNVGGFCLGLAGGLFLYELVGRGSKWSDILSPLETAMTDSTLGLMDFLQSGYGLNDTNELVCERLVLAAWDVLVAERNFKHTCKKDSISEKEAIEVGQKSLLCRSNFDKMLSRAVEFGLSNCGPKPYFQAAQRRMG